ncbi:MAG: glycosyltransferase, partial [Myxococcaceae bacterium]|nr:glycosyltransferase [Myxococcaceae bacterium]
VPCYKYAHYLRECVESILTQPGVDLRVLIIDDASPDDTPQVAARLVAEDPRVEYRRHTINRGHIATFNEGLEWVSESDYAVLLSADDLLTPGALQRAARLMDREPEVGFVYGGVVAFEADQPRPQPRTPAGECAYRIYSGMDWVRAACSKGGTGLTSPEVVVRTALQRRLGGFRTTLSHAGDQEMWMRFAIHAPVGEVLDADQAFYRLHASNMHRQQYGFVEQLRQMKGAFDTVFQEQGDRIPQREEPEYLLHRALALQALWHLCYLYDWGGASPAHAEELERFIGTLHRPSYADAEFMRVYVRYCIKKLLGPRLCASLWAWRRSLRS